MEIIQAVRFSPDGTALRIIDQRALPGKLVERDLRTLDDVCDAIRTLSVRGAPAIGIAAAIGVAVIAAAAPEALTHLEFRQSLAHAAETVRGTRPTAVNLPWAIDRMLAVLGREHVNRDALVAALRVEASAILEEDRAMCRAIGEHGLPLIPGRARVLTHCNAGALATGGMGTALAPIYLAALEGRDVSVFACETRPLMQGSRLTAWELERSGVPVTLLADSMAASLMQRGSVDLVIVGADRIAANGDAANKVGTYALAIAARHHGIPFYVAAPTSTVDPRTATGAAIEIEQRDASELRAIGGIATAPSGVATYNPAFDVTPASLITAIITDRGVFSAPYHFEATRP
ncbi:MAG: Methylthioribose-phosphate isomerase [Gemmatimonadetes bacterium]|nr:Methylthioribose-phosphate isomerase [Gemmatimonadota bacterium]